MCQATCHNDGCADFSRMIESYLCARDRFLKPGGKMFPNAGTLCPLSVDTAGVGPVGFFFLVGYFTENGGSVLERGMVWSWVCKLGQDNGQ